MKKMSHWGYTYWSFWKIIFIQLSWIETTGKFFRNFLRLILFSIEIGWYFSSYFRLSFTDRNSKVMGFDPSKGLLDFGQ